MSEMNTDYVDNSHDNIQSERVGHSTGFHDCQGHDRHEIPDADHPHYITSKTLGEVERKQEIRREQQALWKRERQLKRLRKKNLYQILVLIFLIMGEVS